MLRGLAEPVLIDEWQIVPDVRERATRDRVIVEYGGGRVFAIKIKAGSAPTRDDARHLAWLRTELGDRLIGGAVLHTGRRAFRLSDDIVAAPIAALWS